MPQAKTKKSSQQASHISAFEFCMIGSIAVINDACDWFGISLYLFYIPEIVCGLILMLWCLMRLKTFPGFRLGGTYILESIPLLGDIAPGWTLFIVSVYFSQKKSSLSWSKN